MERHYKDMQDLEFTVERGRLYMLQTRSGKRSAAAAVRIAVEMANEGLISREEAVRRVEPGHAEALLHRQIDPPAKLNLIAEALKVDLERRQFAVDGKIVKEGEEISINGTTGEVILGAVPLIEPTMSGELKTLLSWADQFRRLMVWANADYPRDAQKAREYG